MNKDILGNRMKHNYEEVSKTRLVRRMPVIIRLDGKAFHTFTRGFKKPFDEILIKTMQQTMKYLCENIQGCVLGYTQSDEITLVLIDYKKLDSEAWFDYEVQKLCSISASMATLAFNRFFEDNVSKFKEEMSDLAIDVDEKYLETLNKACLKGAMFDSRCFNIPREEVTNCIFWRQQDATRNSIQMVGQANFSQKELQGKSCNDIQNMLLTQKNINWNNLPTYQKRGSCCIKKTNYIDDFNNLVIDTNWIIDNEIPIFKDEGREYIEKLIMEEKNE